ncbi:MAG: hypothetical protein KAK00_01735 [Nanoarchaeota archaeon]|nr:hypothetical protein [Nanoarchaeota archaeon]
MAKKFWKCKVCADIHFGNTYPKICPTCETKDAFYEITKEETKEAMEI